MWNDQKFTYAFEPGRIHRHEMVMLSAGDCPLFFPMTFLDEPEQVTAVYDCSGYAPLSTFRIEHTGDVLYVLEKVLLILHRSGEYLLLPERILISPETVFYNMKTGDVRIAYVPLQDARPDVHRSLAVFLGRLKEDLCDPFIGFVDALTDRFARDNMNLKDMLTLLGITRRKLDSKTSALS